MSEYEALDAQLRARLGDDQQAAMTPEQCAEALAARERARRELDAELAEYASESLEWATATFEAVAETWPRD